MSKPKYIKTPEKLWELFESYKETVKSNPKEKLISGNKDFVLSKENLEKPLTLSGFYVYGHSQGVTLDHYFKNSENAYEEYRPICSIIKEVIRDDQITGGMIGIYNPSITQRLNGLTEKVKTEHSGTLNIPNVPDIGNRE